MNSASNKIAKRYQNTIINFPPSALDKICDVSAARNHADLLDGTAQAETALSDAGCPQ
jgi:hypothetical protein